MFHIHIFSSSLFQHSLQANFPQIKHKLSSYIAQMTKKVRHLSNFLQTWILPKCSGHTTCLLWIIQHKDFSLTENPVTIFMHYLDVAEPLANRQPWFPTWESSTIKCLFILDYTLHQMSVHPIQFCCMGVSVARRCLNKTVSSKISSLSFSFGRSSNSISNLKGSSATGWNNKYINKHKICIFTLERYMYFIGFSRMKITNVTKGKITCYSLL